MPPETTHPAKRTIGDHRGLNPQPHPQTLTYGGRKCHLVQGPLATISTILSITERVTSNIHFKNNIEIEKPMPLLVNYTIWTPNKKLQIQTVTNIFLS